MTTKKTKKTLTHITGSGDTFTKKTTKHFTHVVVASYDINALRELSLDNATGAAVSSYTAAAKNKTETLEQQALRNYQLVVSWHGSESLAQKGTSCSQYCRPQIFKNAHVESINGESK